MNRNADCQHTLNPTYPPPPSPPHPTAPCPVFPTTPTLLPSPLNLCLQRGSGGDRNPRWVEGGGGISQHSSVTTGKISASQWAAMRAIFTLLVHKVQLLKRMEESLQCHIRKISALQWAVMRAIFTLLSVHKLQLLKRMESHRSGESNPCRPLRLPLSLGQAGSLSLSSPSHLYQKSYTVHTPIPT